MRDDRLFYGTWREDEGRPPANAANEVWSVALTANGFAPSSARLEFKLPGFTDAGGTLRVWSDPPSDLAFSPAGSTLFVAERVRNQDTGLGVINGSDAHQARLLEYHFAKKPNGRYAWYPSSTTKFRVGIGHGANAAGGVSVLSNGRPWATGDALYIDTGVSPELVYGAQKFPFTGSAPSAPYNATSNLVDLDGDVANYDKTQIGGVRVYDPCLTPDDMLPLAFSGPSCQGPGEIRDIIRVTGPLGDRVFAVGDFKMIGGVLANNVAVWDGLTWAPLGAGTDAPVNAVAFRDDGTGPQLYVGGEFTMAGNVVSPLVARWDGTKWSSVGGGLPDAAPGQDCNRGVRALTFFDGGTGPELYATGAFVAPATGVIGLAVSLARWDGLHWRDLDGRGLFTSPSSSSPPCPPNPFTGEGECLAVFDDGTGSALYVGGAFDTLTPGGPAEVPGIARWNGASWASAPPMQGQPTRVRALVGVTTAAGPRLIIGGDIGFSAVAGMIQNVGAHDWATGDWTPLGAGTDDTVYGFAQYADAAGSHVYATGSFTTAGGEAAIGLARFDGESWEAVDAGVQGQPIELLSGPGRVLRAFDTGRRQGLLVGGQFISAAGPAIGPVSATAFSIGPCCPDIFITQAPVSASAVAGSPHTLSVVATSANPLSYQWKRNGIDVPGETGPSYTFTVTAADLSPTEYTVLDA